MKIRFTVGIYGISQVKITKFNLVTDYWLFWKIKNNPFHSY
jgi:hypothetical protein